MTLTRGSVPAQPQENVAQQGERRLSGRRLALLWVASRALVLLALFSFASRVIGDVNYFRMSLDALSRNGLDGTLVEYPAPAVWLVAVPWTATHRLASGDVLYDLAVVGLILLVDLAYTAILARAVRHGTGGAAGGSGLVLWLLAVPALGALTLTRFDIVPGILVGLVVLGYARRPALASTLLAGATAVKLWPVLLLAPLLAASRRWMRVLVPFALTGLVAASATVALAGWARLVSPLVYQRDRGLQIESVPAVPAMLGYALSQPGERLVFAPSRSWEIVGPGTHALLVASTVASGVLVSVLVTLWIRALATRRPLPVDGFVWLLLVAVTGFVVVGRVYSPQYLLWLVPAVAAGLATVDGAARRPLARWAALLVLVLVLSQLVFPVLYTHLLEPGTGTLPTVLVLGARNVLTLVLMVLAVRQGWRATRR